MLYKPVALRALGAFPMMPVDGTGGEGFEQRAERPLNIARRGCLTA